MTSKVLRCDKCNTRLILLWVGGQIPWHACPKCDKAELASKTVRGVRKMIDKETKQEFIKAELKDLRGSYPSLTEQRVREAFEKVAERDEQPANVIEMFIQRHWRLVQEGDAPE